MTEEKKLRRARRQAETWARRSKDPVRIKIVAQFGSLANASKFLDISPTLLWFYLEGEREPPAEVLQALLDATGMTREFWSAPADDASRLAKSA